MPGSIPRPTRLYHITDWVNLARIVRTGELCCKNDLPPHSYASIAYENIQTQRSVTAVPCGTRGELHDYVPFFFCPRPVMLLPITSGRVPGATPHTNIIHLATTVEDVLDAQRDYVFTDGHAIMDYTGFFDDVGKLGRINWNVIPLTQWANTPDNPDRMRQKQAEFLVHRTMPWSKIRYVGVQNTAMRDQVQEVIDGDYPPVHVRKDWYYA